MRKTPAWKYDDTAQWEETREHMEKFVLMKSHCHFFTPLEASELAKQDQALYHRLTSLSFVGPENLDVKSVSEGGGGGVPYMMDVCMYAHVSSLSLIHQLPAARY